MELTIVVKGKLPDSLKLLIEKAQDFIGEMLVAFGVAPDRISSVVSWNMEEEDAQA